MAKRKGSEFRSSTRGVRVVVADPGNASAAASRSFPPFSSSTPSPPSFSASDGVGWDGTKSLILDLINEYRTSEDVESVRKCERLTEELEDGQGAVLDESDRISAALKSRIDEAEEELKIRCDGLAERIEEVTVMEGRASGMRGECDELTKEARGVRRRAELYRIEADEPLAKPGGEGGGEDALDERELRRMAENRKIRHQISLYAKIAGIKWDYDRADLLAGEVNVPSMNAVRAFEIDPEEHDPFDVANELWDLMEGEEPRIASSSLLTTEEVETEAF